MITHNYTVRVRAMGVLAALVMAVMPAWAGETGNTIQGTGDSWLEQTRLLSPAGGRSYYRFGISVAVYGDYALIGSPGPSFGIGYLPGEAYIFKRENGVWREQAKLMPSDSDTGDFFGLNVALSEDVALVGAQKLSAGVASRVYVFTRDGENWTEQQILTGADGGMVDDLFGMSMAIEGDTALIGAPGEVVDGNIFQGAAYVFQRSDGVWSEQARLLADNGTMAEFFGISVALDGTSALIGSPYSMAGGNGSMGVVYEFAQSGGAWNQQTTLASPDSNPGSAFGAKIMLQNDRALIATEGGVPHIFERAGGVWSHSSELTPSLGTPGISYGAALALVGNTALVGDPTGSVGDIEQGVVNVFRSDSGTWSQETRLVASDGGHGDHFGTALAVVDDQVLIGAQSATVHNVSQGAVYLFAELDHAPDSATLEGTLQSLGHCDSDVLPLENASIEVTGAQGTYSTVSRYDGFYRLVLPDSESPVDITVTAPGHLPVTLEGVTFAGGDVLVEDFDLSLEQPCASAIPESISAELDPGQSTTETLTIENLDSGAPLAWSIADTSFMQLAGSVADCELAPGVIVHDHGTVEGGALTNVNWEEVAYVDLFTPQAYPATLREVCIAVAGQNPGDSFEFEIVVLDDDGEDGAPGTELGVLSAAVEDLPVWPITRPVWAKFDVSSLGVLIEEGSVYIGMRWSPSIENDIMIPIDMFPDNRPVGYAGGYSWVKDVTDGWQAYYYPNVVGNHYRSLPVRAATDPRGCLAPSEVPWLSLDQDSGTTSPGAGDTVQVTLDGSDLDPGVYSSSLCITTNDPAQPLLVVPVELGVTGSPGPGVLAADPGVVDFGEVAAGSSQIDSFVVTNDTAPGADDIEISSFELTAGAPEFQLAGGSCEAGTVLAPGATCRIRVTLQPGEVSNTVFDGTVTVETTDGQDMTVTLAGEVPPNPPAIAVDPGSLSSVLVQGQSGNQSLTVANPGDQALNWTVTEDGTLGGRVLQPGTTVTLPETLEVSRAANQWSAPDKPDVAASNPFHTRGGQVTLTHSTSMDIEAGAQTCSNQSDGTTLANSYLRTFTLADFGIDGPLEVSEVTFGIAQLTDVIPVTVNLYTLDGDFVYDNMTLIGSVSEGLEPVDIQNPVLVTFPVAARVPPGATLVVEIVAPDMTGVGGFYPGANSLGESAPSYIVSSGCAINDPAPYSSIGFADTHLVMSVTGTAEPLNCVLPDWVQTNPADGTVSGGDSQTVELSFDASNTPPSLYHGTMCLSSNAPSRSLVTIPLELTVEEGQAGPGELAAQPPELDFGEIDIDTSTIAGVTVTNVAEAGAQTISVASVELLSGAPAFELIGGDCDGTGLAPGESCSVEIRFEPSAEQLYTGALRVHSGYGQSVVIGLSGTGAVRGAAIFSDRFEQL